MACLPEMIIRLNGSHRVEVVKVSILPKTTATTTCLGGETITRRHRYFAETSFSQLSDAAKLDGTRALSRPHQIN